MFCGGERDLVRDPRLGAADPGCRLVSPIAEVQGATCQGNPDGLRNLLLLFNLGFYSVFTIILLLL